jgi:hypothetical protein
MEVITKMVGDNRCINLKASFVWASNPMVSLDISLHFCPNINGLCADDLVDVSDLGYCAQHYTV